MIVNEEDRNILDILDGRDGKALKEWLKHNKQVRIIARDRASAYAKNELLRRKVYEEIQQLYDAGYSSRKIAKLLQVSRNTMSKVLHGDINELCRNSRALMLDKYLAEIIKVYQISMCI